MEVLFDVFQLIGLVCLVIYAVKRRNTLSYVESTYPQEWPGEAKYGKGLIGRWGRSVAVNESLKAGELSKLEDARLVKAKKEQFLLIAAGAVFVVAGTVLDWFLV